MLLLCWYWCVSQECASIRTFLFWIKRCVNNKLMHKRTILFTRYTACSTWMIISDMTRSNIFLIISGYSLWGSLFFISRSKFSLQLACSLIESRNRLFTQIPILFFVAYNQIFSLPHFRSFWGCREISGRRSDQGRGIVQVKINLFCLAFLECDIVVPVLVLNMSVLWKFDILAYCCIQNMVIWQWWWFTSLLDVCSIRKQQYTGLVHCIL